MTERPMLFSAPMVRKLLTDEKTQTRRILKGSVEQVRRSDWHSDCLLVHKATCQRSFCESVDDGELACGGWELTADGRGTRSPYGRVGDRLWVRESYMLEWPEADRPDDEDEYRRWVKVHYAATDPKPELFSAAADTDKPLGWTPSIHMFRWASRLTLGLTGVRVERLHDISEEDAIAEGCPGHDLEPASEGGTIYALKGRSSAPSPRAQYMHLWDSINGPGAWALNPWVWCLTFKRVEAKR